MDANVAELVQHTSNLRISSPRSRPKPRIRQILRHGSLPNNLNGYPLSQAKDALSVESRQLSYENYSPVMERGPIHHCRSEQSLENNDRQEWSSPGHTTYTQHTSNTNGVAAYVLQPDGTMAAVRWDDKSALKNNASVLSALQEEHRALMYGKTTGRIHGVSNSKAKLPSQMLNWLVTDDDEFNSSSSFNKHAGSVRRQSAPSDPATHISYQTLTTTPTYHIDTSTPTYQTTATSPTYQTTATSPAYQTTATSPTYQTTATSPTYQTTTTRPTYQTTATSSTYQTTVISPTYQTTTTSPTYQTTATSPTYQITAISPTYQTTTTSPTYQTTATSPTYQTTAISPTYQTTATSPTYQITATSPSYEDPATSPSYEDPATSPYYQTDIFTHTYQTTPNNKLMPTYRRTFSTPAVTADGVRAARRSLLSPEEFRTYNERSQSYSTANSKLRYMKEDQNANSFSQLNNNHENLQRNNLRIMRSRDIQRTKGKFANVTDRSVTAPQSMSMQSRRHSNEPARSTPSPSSAQVQQVYWLPETTPVCIPRYHQKKVPIGTQSNPHSSQQQRQFLLEKASASLRPDDGDSDNEIPVWDYFKFFEHCATSDF